MRPGKCLAPCPFLHRARAVPVSTLRASKPCPRLFSSLYSLTLFLDLIPVHPLSIMKFTSLLRTTLLALSMLASTGALAQSTQLGSLRISDAWARTTVPQQANGAAYVQIENTGKQADKLLRASSPAAQAVEMHAMTMDHDIMRMRQLDDLALPAKGALAMKPGSGAHLMLIGLKQPLQAGQSLNLVLEFEKAGKVTISAKVKSLP